MILDLLGLMASEPRSCSKIMGNNCHVDGQGTPKTIPPWCAIPEGCRKAAAKQCICFALLRQDAAGLSSSSMAPTALTSHAGTLCAQG